MKILSICRVCTTHRPGGMPFVMMDRACELAKQGHEVIVLTTGPTASVQVDGFEVRHLDCQPMTYTAKFAEECCREYERICPDILHLDSLDRSRTWWCDAKHKTRVAVTMHGTGVGAMLTKWNEYRARGSQSQPVMDWQTLRQESDALKTSHAQLAISLSEHLHIRDVLGCNDVKLVYNPIPEYFFAPITKDRPPVGGPVLCAAISGHTTRGFGVAQQACKLLGRELRTVKDVPRDQMPQVYDECSGVLLPTYYAQGFDLVVAEAIARDRPVFAAATGSYLAEADNYRGWLVTVPGYAPADYAAVVGGWRWGFQGRQYAERHRPAAHVKAWLEAVL